MSRTSYVLAVVVAALVVVVLGAWFVSGRTAENGCTVEADRRGASYVTQSWSWSPLGTTCRFDVGEAETRLFW